MGGVDAMNSLGAFGRRVLDLVTLVQQAVVLQAHLSMITTTTEI